MLTKYTPRDISRLTPSHFLHTYSVPKKAQAKERVQTLWTAGLIEKPDFYSVLKAPGVSCTLLEAETPYYQKSTSKRARATSLKSLSSVLKAGTSLKA